MDPLSALGIAASVAQFLDLGIKLTKRLTEYNKTGMHDVPKSLQSINTQLPLLLNALNRVKSDVAVDRLDTDTKCILRGVIHGCSGIVNELEDLMDKASRQPGESLATKLKKIMASLKTDERILALDKNLQTYIQVLILHHVVDAAEVPTVVAEEIKYYEVREKMANPYMNRPQLIERLDELFYDAARSQVKKPTVVVLQGDKSVGKSQLALEYCQQAYSYGQFQDVFWINASSPDALELSLESMAAVIRKTTEGRSEEKLRFVKNWLEDRWHPWLLVLDGYDHKAFGYEPVLARLPQKGYGGILVTSRQLGASILGTVVEVLKFFTAEEEESLNYRLGRAVESLDWPKVQSVVDQGFNVNQVDLSMKWPYVTRAALLGFDQAVDLFLQKGASMNLTANITPPLVWASSRGHINIVKRLLDEEDSTQFRLQPHQYASCTAEAIENGQLEVVKALVERRGVSLDTKDSYGRSGFTRAAYKGKMDMLQFLVQHGASPKTPEARAEALIEAVKKNDMALVKFFVEEAKFDPSGKSEDGSTPLYEAASLQGGETTEEESGLSMLRYLLEHGADATLPIKSGEIPLHPAAMRDQVEKVRLLLKAGSEVNHRGDGWSPITQAAKYNSPKVFPILLSWPMPDEEKKKQYRADVLQAAARWDKKELALAVLKADGGADVNAKDWRGQTPLLLAILSKSVPIARMLIRHGAKQDIPDDAGQYPILIAAEKGLDLIVRELLKVKDSPSRDIKDKEENTALHLAAKGKHIDTIKVLLDSGVDRDEMNAYGETALDIVEELKPKDKQLEEVIRILNDTKI